MQKHINSRLSQQIKQIKALLVDFKKARGKCLELASQLRLDINKDNFYSSTERTTMMKCQLLDLKGLISLKNSLVNLISQLLQKQRELSYQKQKKEAQQSLKIDSRVRPSDSVRSSRQDNNAWGSKDSFLDSMKSSRVSDMRASRKVEVPFYKIDQQVTESVETKLDRVSKFIASLKKSIKSATDSAGCKFRTKEYLLEQEPYLKAKQQLQRYLTRDEELDTIFTKAIKTEIQRHFKENATLTPDGQYYLVKVPKEKHPFKKHTTNQDKISSAHPISVIQPKRIAQSQKQMETQSMRLSKAEAQAEADFQQIKVQLQKRTQSFAELFNEMHEVVEKGSSKLSQLRQKRKEAFKKDDELWDQL